MNNLHNFNKLALEEHLKLAGKLKTVSKVSLKTNEQLSTLYTPGVGAVSSHLASHTDETAKFTIASDTVAVVSDGSAVLGLGNVGAEAALPVMEGKAILFSELAGINAFPIVLRSQDEDEIVRTILDISAGFAAINLEDIAAPKCFSIEQKLHKLLNIPVVHDDQHATAIVVLAGLINALKVVSKNSASIKVVVLGAGAAGNAVTKLLVAYGIKNIIVVDSKGILVSSRADLDTHKQELARITNPDSTTGSLDRAIEDADVFIGLSSGGKITHSEIEKMNKDAIVFALANPTPEIDPEDAKKAGAAVIATGRSDYENQINNVLVFPGLFKGLIINHHKSVGTQTKLKAALALAGCVKTPTPAKIVPDVFDSNVVKSIVKALA